MTLPTLLTPRLRLRHLVREDAGYIIEQLADPDFVEFVGDRGVRTEADAIAYLERGWASYATHGVGSWAVERRDAPGVIGTVGLYARDTLDAPDLGFAFLPAARGRGLALEAARAALDWAVRDRGLRRVLAITTDAHVRSQRLLERLGMCLEGHTRIPGDDALLRLYAYTTAAPPET
ncbi:MAG: GNAT family N-acetyltransferase [Nannocystaceae bacterium]